MESPSMHFIIPLLFSFLSPLVTGYNFKPHRYSDSAQVPLPGEHYLLTCPTELRHSANTQSLIVILPKPILLPGREQH